VETKREVGEEISHAVAVMSDYSDAPGGRED
jgi:hypothetical protein